MILTLTFVIGTIILVAVLACLLLVKHEIDEQQAHERRMERHRFDRIMAASERQPPRASGLKSDRRSIS